MPGISNSPYHPHHFPISNIPFSEYMYAISQEQFVHLNAGSSSSDSSGSVPLVMIESFSGGQHPHPHNPVVHPHAGAAPGNILHWFTIYVCVNYRVNHANAEMKFQTYRTGRRSQPLLLPNGLMQARSAVLRQFTSAADISHMGVASPALRLSLAPLPAKFESSLIS